MPREMIINAAIRENIRAAIVRDGKLWDYFEDSQSAQRTRGNIYLGRVVHEQPGLDAYFVDYGERRQGLLPADGIPAGAVLSGAPRKADEGGRVRLSPGQKLLVQVEKEPIDQKGARLTADISLAGRFLVLTPLSELLGVSRRIADEEERQRSRELAHSLKPPAAMGLIVRTVAAGQPLRALRQDLNYLLKLWQGIRQRAARMEKPGLLHAEQQLLLRLLRDYFTSDIDAVWVDEPEALESAREFFRLFSPRQLDRLHAYNETQPIFSRFGLEEQVENIFQRRLELPSGGSLVIEPTEALVAIDVNSGRASSGRDGEQTALRVNLEAASEIARQLRLRNLGGIIVIDFIDMEREENRRRVEQQLRTALKDDKARIQVARISAFGLCLLTRQRTEQALRTLWEKPCPCCQGTGRVRGEESLSLLMLRRIQELAARRVSRITIRTSCQVANYLQGRYRQRLAELEKQHHLVLEILAEPSRQPAEFLVEFDAPAQNDAPRAPAPPPNNKEGEKTTVTAPLSAVALAPSARRPSRRRRRRKRPASTPPENQA